MNFKAYCQDLETKIQKGYEEGITVSEAEKFAGEFLRAQLIVNQELTKQDLDSRMKKSGTKAIRSALYLESTSKSDKKPTEAYLAAMLDSNPIVESEQKALDIAEVGREELKRLYDIFVNAHIFYRSIAKGSFQ